MAHLRIHISTRKGNDNCETIIVITFRDTLSLTFIISTKSQALIILSNDNAVGRSGTGCD